jgi:hypothetical protein
MRGGGLLFGAVDGVAVFTFFAVAATYFLAPVLGYEPQRRGPIGTSLYLLLAYAGLSVLQVAFLFVQMIEKGGRMGGGGGELTVLAFFAFAILKLLLFFLALLLYVMGLQSLRLRRDGREDFRRDAWPPPADEPRYDR